MALQTPPQPPGTGSPPGGRRGQLLVLAVLGVVLAAGLVLAFLRLTDGDGDKASLSEAPAPTSTPATPTTANPDQAVLDAYYRSEKASLEAGSTADPASPALLAAYTGEALREARAGVAGLRANGLVVKGTYETADARVLSISGTTATVRAIGCDRSFKHDAKTGQLRDSARVVRFDEEVTLVFVDGTWKVSKIVGQEAGECAA